MYNKLNQHYFFIDKPKKWIYSHFELMVRTIYNYQCKKRFKGKLRAYKSIYDNDYILIINNDIYHCENISGICELIFPLYRDIKKYNDNEELKKYQKKLFKKEVVKNGK